MTKPYPNRIQRKEIARIVNHPAYNGKTHENDVALIRLASPMSITSYVNFACLPGKDPGLEESVMIGM
jgi:serine protease 36/transmembrane serine protease 9